MWGYGSHSTPSSNSTGFEETSLELPSSNSTGFEGASSNQLTSVRASWWSLEASAWLMQWQIGSFKYSLKQHCLFCCKKATTKGTRCCFEVTAKLIAVLPSSTCRSNHVCWIHCMVNGIWNKATKIVDEVCCKNRWTYGGYLFTTMNAFPNLQIALFQKNHFERCQVRYLDVWNTNNIPLRDVPFERKCKCPLKGTTMNDVSNLPTMFFNNIPLIDARLVTLRNMWNTKIFLWEIFILRENFVVFETLGTRPKNRGGTCLIETSLSWLFRSRIEGLCLPLCVMPYLVPRRSMSQIHPLERTLSSPLSSQKQAVILPLVSGT